MSSAEHMPVLDLDVLEHLVGEAELLRELVHDVVVVPQLEGRLDDLLAPLQRTVRGGARTVHFERGAGRQEIGAVLAVADRRERRRMRIDDDEKLELVHAFDHFGDAGHGVAAVAHHEHAPERVALVDVVRPAGCTASNHRVEVIPGVSMFSFLERGLRPAFAGTSSNWPCSQL